MKRFLLSLFVIAMISSPAASYAQDVCNPPLQQHFTLACTVIMLTTAGAGYVSLRFGLPRIAGMCFGAAAAALACVGSVTYHCYGTSHVIA